MNGRFECFADAPCNRIEAARLAIGRAVNAEGEGEAAAILATIDPGGDTMAEKALALLRAMIEDGEALTPLNIIMSAKAEHGNAEGEALTAFTLSCAAATKKSATGTQDRDRPAPPAPAQPPQKGTGEKRAVEAAQGEERHRGKGNPRPRAESPAKAAGWVKFHRRALANPLYLEKPFDGWHAFFHLVALANHEPGTVKKRGNLIPIPRGGVGRSEEKLANDWGWSRRDVRDFLKRLETEGMIAIVRNARKLNVIVIANYDKYQSEKSR